MEIESIIKDIEKAYGNLKNPSFDFITKVTPYDLVDELKRDFIIEDDTDHDYDMAFDYFLKKDNERWRLQLSKVGRYALVFRSSTENVFPVITAGDALTDNDRALFSVLEKHHFRCLSSTEMWEKIADDDGSNETSLNKLLFERTLPE